MKLTSSAFFDGQNIPEKFTCKGENVNPDLLINGAPENTKSFILAMEDENGTFGTFTHWLVYGINAKTTFIPQNSVPELATQVENDYGKGVYSGPCPPAGKRGSLFKVYALNTLFQAPFSADKNMIMKAANPHILDTAILTGYFGK